MKNYLFILIGIVVIAFGCTKEPIGQQPIEKIPPGPVTDVKVLIDDEYCLIKDTTSRAFVKE